MTSRKEHKKSSDFERCIYRLRFPSLLPSFYSFLKFEIFFWYCTVQNHHIIMPRRLSVKKQIKQKVYIKPARKSTKTNLNCQPALLIDGPYLPIKYSYTENGIRDNCK